MSKRAIVSLILLTLVLSITGCEKLQPVLTIEARLPTAESEAVAQPTSTPASATVAETATTATEESEPTAVPTAEPSPSTKEPEATLPATVAPTIVWPPDGTIGPAIQLVWKWDQPLADDEWFEVQVWPDQPDVQPTIFAWQKDNNTKVTANQLMPGRYRWRVIVVRAVSQALKCQEPPYPCPTCPDWIVFQSAIGDGNADIFRMRLDGSQVDRITTDTGDDAWPSMGFDSSQVAFTSNRDGDWEIYRMNIDGSEQTNVTQYPNADDMAPSLSCDSIAFQSNRDGNWEIYKMGLNGQKQVRLTNDPANDQAPSWSPDGQWIAFQSDRNGNVDIYITGQNGQQLRALVNNPATDRNPTWSPDGQWIAFESDRAGQFDIYKINLATEEVVQLTDDPGSDTAPVWMPYCDYIFWQADRKGDLDIYRMDQDGTQATSLGAALNTESWLLSSTRGRDKVRCAELSGYSEEGTFTIERPNTRASLSVTPPSVPSRTPSPTPTRRWHIWYPTATPTSRATLPVVTPSSTPVRTIVPPTATSTPPQYPAVTATYTPVPPTATWTAVPATATYTPAPPTATNTPVGGYPDSTPLPPVPTLTPGSYD